MPRIARVVAEGIPHHVTQRGNGRQQLFHCPEDYQLYKDLIHRYAADSGLDLWAYCLMPNHVHLICLPRTKRALASALGRTHADYARHFNLVGRTCGHVWQARYFSCPLDRDHCWRAMAYVERNPVRAGLVPDFSDYRWSSAAAHIGLRTESMLDLRPWFNRYDPNRWVEVLNSSVGEEALIERIREATLRGRPFGDATFVLELEEATGRRLRPRSPGRPKNEAAQSPETADLRVHSRHRNNALRAVF